MYTYIPLRFENKEVKLGSATWSLGAALGKALATNSNTAKNPQTELSARTTERQEKKMEGHIVGTGVSVPSPLQAECFGKAGKAGKRQIQGGFRRFLRLQQAISPETRPLLSL